MKNYLNRYMATCVPGLESVLTDEIKELRHINNLSETRGKVTFDCLSADLDSIRLKCADNLYKLYRIFAVGCHKVDLPAIGANIKDIDFEMGSRVPHRIIISASRSGKHTYSRHNVAQYVESGLISTERYIKGDSENHDLAVRVDIADNICAVYKQLTPSEMRFRGGFNSVPGGIRPTVAHCLVRLSLPQNNDVFYDPFCGAGTIPYERSYYKSKKIYASDNNEEIVEIARRNLKQSAIVFSGDAAKSKMKERGVNIVITNLPWDRQIKVDNIYELYLGFIKELKRILTGDGKAIVLSGQVALIEDICIQSDLSCSRITELSLHGLHPVVFIITR